jgi:hypothetical protein
MSSRADSESPKHAATSAALLVAEVAKSASQSGINAASRRVNDRNLFVCGYEEGGWLSRIRPAETIAQWVAVLSHQDDGQALALLPTTV